MFLVLILLLGVALIPITRSMVGNREFPKFATIIIGSFILRILLNVLVTRSVSFFSHGGTGSDGQSYENFGAVISTVWDSQGIRFMTADDLPDIHVLRNTAFVCNLYALVIFICGTDTPACPAVVAFLACTLCLIIYRFCLTIGASESAAFRAFLLTIFGPSFLYHTSDTFKDGINAFLVVSTVYLAVLLSRKLTVLRLALVGPVLWALWNVRPYMVFLSLLPVLIVLVGLRSGKDQRLNARNLAMLGVISIVAILALGYGAGGGFFSSAESQFAQGTASATHEGNAEGGSGVTFDDGGNPWGAIVPKLFYTVFSPFPWMGGSIGLQIGKIDALIWYFIIYGAYQSAKLLWRRDKATLLMLLMFIGPGTVMYALSMSNVGLIVRQRMPIIIVTTILASIWWTEQEKRRVAQSPRTQRPRPGALPTPSVAPVPALVTLPHPS